MATRHPLATYARLNCDYGKRGWRVTHGYAVATLLQHAHDWRTFTYTLLTRVPIDDSPRLTHGLFTVCVRLTSYYPWLNPSRPTTTFHNLPRLYTFYDYSLLSSVAFDYDTIHWLLPTVNYWPLLRLTATYWYWLLAMVVYWWLLIRTATYWWLLLLIATYCYLLILTGTCRYLLLFTYCYLLVRTDTCC